MYKRAALGVALSCAIGHAVASTIVPVEFVFDTASNCNELNYGVSICGMSDTEYYTHSTSTCYFNWSTFTLECTDALTRAQINENFATEFTKNLNNLLGDRGIDVKLAGFTYGNIATAVAAYLLFCVLIQSKLILQMVDIKIALFLLENVHKF